MITLPGGERVLGDSTGKPLFRGDRVRFRGQNYTLKDIGPEDPDIEGVNQLIMKEELHTEEIPTELSVDKIG